MSVLLSCNAFLDSVGFIQVLFMNNGLWHWVYIMLLFEMCQGVLLWNNKPLYLMTFLSCNIIMNIRFRYRIITSIMISNINRLFIIKATSYRPGGLYIMLSRGTSFNQLGHCTLCLHLNYSLNQLGHCTLTLHLLMFTSELLLVQTDSSRESPSSTTFGTFSVWDGE